MLQTYEGVIQLDGSEQFISDTHFDHDFVRRKCGRPFLNNKEMNQVMLENFHDAIGYDGMAFHLGDVSWWRGPRRTEYWFDKLTKYNKNVVLLRGNHDRPKRVPYHRHLVGRFERYCFYIVHDQKEVPSNWTEWVIHGHVHNNDLRNYPLVNKKNKTINVSVELTDYKPIRLEEIIRMIEN